MVKVPLMKSQQTASTSTGPTIATSHASVTATVSTPIGVLVIACDRPTVARALDLLIKLVIKATGILVYCILIISSHAFLVCMSICDWI